MTRACPWLWAYITVDLKLCSVVYVTQVRAPLPKYDKSVSMVVSLYCMAHYICVLVFYDSIVADKSVQTIIFDRCVIHEKDLTLIWWETYLLFLPVYVYSLTDAREMVSVGTRHDTIFGRRLLLQKLVKRNTATNYNCHASHSILCKTNDCRSSHLYCIFIDTGFLCWPICLLSCEWMYDKQTLGKCMISVWLIYNWVILLIIHARFKLECVRQATD